MAIPAKILIFLTHAPNFGAPFNRRISNRKLLFGTAGFAELPTFRGANSGTLSKPAAANFRTGACYSLARPPALEFFFQRLFALGGRSPVGQIGGAGGAAVWHGRGRFPAGIGLSPAAASVDEMRAPPANRDRFSLQHGRRLGAIERSHRFSTPL